MIKFSFHYLELKRTKTVDIFFENIKKIRSAGCSFSLELTPNDETIDEINEIKKICLQKVGALCHISVARDNSKKELPILSKNTIERYNEIWSSFDSLMFKYKLSVFNKKREEFCYAGDWTAYLNMGTGELTQCYKGNFIQNVFEDIDKKIDFCAIGNNCKEPYCFNAHAWLAFGAIPEHDSPVYSEMRNRTCSNGREWLTTSMKEFMSSKLTDSNSIYSEEEKNKANKFSKKHSKVRKILSKAKKMFITFSGPTDTDRGH
jgi:hypothetical protein